MSNELELEGLIIERCYWYYLLLTNSRKVWNGVKMVTIALTSFVI